MKAHHGDLVNHIPTGRACVVANKDATRFMPLSTMWDIGAGAGKTLVFEGDLSTLFEIYPAKTENSYVEFPSKKRQLIDSLRSLQEDTDHERAHSLADDLLLEYIRDEKVNTRRKLQRSRTGSRSGYL